MKRSPRILSALLAPALVLAAALLAPTAPAGAATTAPTHLTATLTQIPGTVDYEFTVVVHAAEGTGTPTGTVSAPYGERCGLGNAEVQVVSYELDADGTATGVFRPCVTPPDIIEWQAAGQSGPPPSDFTVTFTYSGSTVHAGSSLTVDHVYPREPVVLTAEPVQKPGTLLTFQLVARLTTADGTPIAGRWLTFVRGKADPATGTNRTVCTAATDANGVARCKSGPALQVYLSGGGWVTSPRATIHAAAATPLPLR